MTWARARAAAMEAAEWEWCDAALSRAISTALQLDGGAPLTAAAKRGDAKSAGSKALPVGWVHPDRLLLYLRRILHNPPQQVLCSASLMI